MKALRLFLVITLWLPILLLYPTSAKADQLPSYVSTEVTVGGEGVILIADSVFVNEQGSLVIRAGTTILFTPESQVVVDGSLKLDGNSAAPVVLSILNPQTTWLGIHTDCNAKEVDVTHTQVTNLKGDLSLCGKSVNLQGITFQDSPTEHITLGSSNWKYTLPELSLRDISFNTNSWGIATSSIGLTLLGNFNQIALDSITFPRKGTLSSLEQNNLIHISGTRNNVYLSHLTAGICQLNIVSSKPTDLLLGVDPLCSEPITPIVFIPGYGTSINSRLFSSTSENEIDPTGWHFLNLLTSSYSTFFQWLDTNKIPYEVAYYDWRLPAEVNASKYLLPIINKAKKEFQTEQVNIVAHSFGGIVSRAYIQGLEYQGDVSNLVELATPNQGAAKAYSVWEGGQLPGDWSEMNNLLRLYQYQHRSENLSFTKVVRSYFASTRELLPTYPTLRQAGNSIDPTKLIQQNTYLTKLNSEVNVLSRRTNLIAVSSGDQSTLDQLYVNPPKTHAAEWEDGTLTSVQPFPPLAGDGTVLQSSADALPSHHLHVSGDHMQVVAAAASQVLPVLYTNQTIQPPPTLSLASRETRHILWFSFDCPVTVTIESPNGTHYDSTHPTDQFEEEQDQSFLWLLVPEEVGKYTVTITATADTEVRWWVNAEEPQVLEMKQDQVSTQAYTNTTTTLFTSSEAATPLPSSPVAELPLQVSTLEVPQLLSFSWLFPALPNFTKIVTTVASSSFLSSPPVTWIRENNLEQRSILGTIGVITFFLLLPP